MKGAFKELARRSRMTDDMEVISQFDHEGIEGVVLFVRASHYTGYVGVPKGHPWYGKSYEEINNLYGEGDDYKYVEVHGGLTYASGSEDYPVSEPAGRWWVGFDCAHAGDVMTDRASTMSDYYEPDSRWRTEWTAEKVVAEVRELATKAARDGVRLEGAC